MNTRRRRTLSLLERRRIVGESPIYLPDRYMVLHGRDGRTFNMYCDPDRLEKHMLDLLPHAAPAIREFISYSHAIAADCCTFAVLGRKIAYSFHQNRPSFGAFLMFGGH